MIKKVISYQKSTDAYDILIGENKKTGELVNFWNS